MLSLFPQLFFLAPLGYALLRATLAIVFLFAAYAQWKKPGVLARLILAMEVILAISLAAGYLTQLAALLSIVIFIVWVVRPDMRPYPPSTVILAGIMATILLIGGAGPFALDLPL